VDGQTNPTTSSPAAAAAAVVLEDNIP